MTPFPVAVDEYAFMFVLPYVWMTKKTGIVECRNEVSDTVTALAFLYFYFSLFQTQGRLNDVLELLELDGRNMEYVLLYSSVSHCASNLSLFSSP